jgi:hypothetical protein
MEVCFAAYAYDCIGYCDADKTSNHISSDEWTLRRVKKLFPVIQLHRQVLQICENLLQNIKTD